MERLLTIDEVAELVGLSKRTLYTMRTRGGGPPAAKLGRLRYRPEDVERWVAERVEKRTPVPVKGRV